MMISEQNITKFRLIYPILLLLSCVFTFLQMSFANRVLILVVGLMLSIIGLLTVMSFLKFKMRKSELILVVIYPIAVAFSLVPYHVFLLIGIVIAVESYYKTNRKSLKRRLLLIHLVVWIIISSLSFATYIHQYYIFELRILSSKYSTDRQHRTDRVLFDENIIGGHILEVEYRIYFGFVKRRENIKTVSPLVY